MDSIRRASSPVVMTDQIYYCHSYHYYTNLSLNESILNCYNVHSWIYGFKFSCDMNIILIQKAAMEITFDIYFGDIVDSGTTDWSCSMQEAS